MQNISYDSALQTIIDGINSNFSELYKNYNTYESAQSYPRLQELTEDDKNTLQDAIRGWGDDDIDISYLKVMGVYDKDANDNISMLYTIPVVYMDKRFHTDNALSNIASLKSKTDCTCTLAYDGHNWQFVQNIPTIYSDGSDLYYKVNQIKTKIRVTPVANSSDSDSCITTVVTGDDNGDVTSNISDPAAYDGAYAFVIYEPGTYYISKLTRESSKLKWTKNDELAIKSIPSGMRDLINSSTWRWRTDSSGYYELGSNGLSLASGSANAALSLDKIVNITGESDTTTDVGLHWLTDEIDLTPGDTYTIEYDATTSMPSSDVASLVKGSHAKYITAEDLISKGAYQGADLGSQNTISILGSSTNRDGTQNPLSQVYLNTPGLYISSGVSDIDSDHHYPYSMYDSRAAYDGISDYSSDLQFVNAIGNSYNTVIDNTYKVSPSKIPVDQAKTPPSHYTADIRVPDFAFKGRFYARAASMIQAPDNNNSENLLWGSGKTQVQSTVGPYGDKELLMLNRDDFEGSMNISVTTGKWYTIETWIRKKPGASVKYIPALGFFIKRYNMSVTDEKGNTTKYTYLQTSDGSIDRNKIALESSPTKEVQYRWHYNTGYNSTNGSISYSNDNITGGTAIIDSYTENNITWQRIRYSTQFPAYVDIVAPYFINADNNWKSDGCWLISGTVIYSSTSKPTDSVPVAPRKWLYNNIRIYKKGSGLNIDEPLNIEKNLTTSGNILIGPKKHLNNDDPGDYSGGLKADTITTNGQIQAKRAIVGPGSQNMLLSNGQELKYLGINYKFPWGKETGYRWAYLRGAHELDESLDTLKLYENLISKAKENNNTITVANWGDMFFTGRKIFNLPRFDGSAEDNMKGVVDNTNNITHMFQSNNTDIIYYSLEGHNDIVITSSTLNDWCPVEDETLSLPSKSFSAYNADYHKSVEQKRTYNIILRVYNTNTIELSNFSNYKDLDNPRSLVQFHLKNNTGQDISSLPLQMFIGTLPTAISDAHIKGTTDAWIDNKMQLTINNGGDYDYYYFAYPGDYQLNVGWYKLDIKSDTSKISSSVIYAQMADLNGDSYSSNSNYYIPGEFNLAGIYSPSDISKENLVAENSIKTSYYPYRVYQYNPTTKKYTWVWKTGYSYSSISSIYSQLNISVPDELTGNCDWKYKEKGACAFWDPAKVPAIITEKYAGAAMNSKNPSDIINLLNCASTETTVTQGSTSETSDNSSIISNNSTIIKDLIYILCGGNSNASEYGMYTNSSWYNLPYNNSGESVLYTVTLNQVVHNFNTNMNYTVPAKKIEVIISGAKGNYTDEITDQTITNS